MAFIADITLRFSTGEGRMWIEAGSDDCLLPASRRNNRNLGGTGSLRSEWLTARTTDFGLIGPVQKLATIGSDTILTILPAL